MVDEPQDISAPSPPIPDHNRNGKLDNEDILVALESEAKDGRCNRLQPAHGIIGASRKKSFDILHSPPTEQTLDILPSEEALQLAVATHLEQALGLRAEIPPETYSVALIAIPESRLDVKSDVEHLHALSQTFKEEFPMKEVTIDPQHIAEIASYFTPKAIEENRDKECKLPTK